MARNFTPATEIVLGYSNYEKYRDGLIRKSLSTLLNSMRYLGMAVSGHPYMGTGRNMAYRKTLYYKQKGCLPPESANGEDGCSSMKQPVHTIHELKPALKV